MKRFLKWFLIVSSVLAATHFLFSLYAHFLLDYSLENLEFAAAATQKKVSPSPVSQKIYQSVVQDLALEEAANEKTSYENLALLGLASRSIDEAQDRAGYHRASVYLNQVVQNKLPQRSSLLRSLDLAYREVQRIQQQIQSFFHYAQKRLKTKLPEVEQPFEYSSLLLLTQAEEKEKVKQYDQAEQLYRKYLKSYAGRSDSGLVSLALAQTLMKEKKWDDAEVLLNDIQGAFIGSEESDIASKLKSRIHFLKSRSRLIDQLEEKVAQIPQASEELDRLQFRLALAYLSSEQFPKAQELFQKLKDSPKADIRQKAKFYMAWIYKLNLQYDRGEKMLLDLMKDPSLVEDLKLGLRAELADIYYQKREPKKSLLEYQEISKSVNSKTSKVQDEHLNIKALNTAWRALAELEQANIYFFDLKDRVEGQNRLQNVKDIFTDTPFREIEIGFDSGANTSLRDRAFQALQARQVNLAFDLFSKNLTYHPDDAWTHAALATLYVLQGDLNQALEYAQKGVGLGADEYTLAAAGYVYGVGERYDEALVYYQQALGRDTKYPPARFNLACIYLKMGKYQEGLKILSELEKQTNSLNRVFRSKILNNMGYAFWWLGDHQKAEELFRQAVKTSPDFVTAQTNLSEISTGNTPQPINLRE